MIYPRQTEVYRGSYTPLMSSMRHEQGGQRAQRDRHGQGRRGEDLRVNLDRETPGGRARRVSLFVKYNHFSLASAKNCVILVVKEYLK